MQLPNEDKANHMRVESLIPSKIELIYNCMPIDPLGDCLTRSLSLKELDCDKIVSDPKQVETILSLEENEEKTNI